MHSLLKAIDKYLGSLLIILLTPFSVISKLITKNMKIEPKRVLIIRLWTLGETLLTFSMIEELRKKYKNSKISVLCQKPNKVVFELNKNIDEIIVFDFKSIISLLFKFKSFDYTIDTEPWFKVSALLSCWFGKKRIGFSHGMRSLMYTEKVKFYDRQYEAQTFLDLLKVLKIKKEFSSFKKLEIPKSEINKVEALLKKNNISKKDNIIGICAGAEDAIYRMWLPAGFADVASYLQKKYKAKVIFIGSKREWALSESIKAMSKKRKNIFNFSGKTSLKGLFYLIEKMNLLVTNDTGPMHVAAVQNTRTISLFGPNLPIRFSPRTNKSISIYRGNKKNPLINVHKGQIPNSNDRKYFEPIENITTKEVKKAIDKILKK